MSKYHYRYMTINLIKGAWKSIVSYDDYRMITLLFIVFFCSYCLGKWNMHYLNWPMPPVDYLERWSLRHHLQLLDPVAEVGDPLDDREPGRDGVAMPRLGDDA